MAYICPNVNGGVLLSPFFTTRFTKGFAKDARRLFIEPCLCALCGKKISSIILSKKIRPFFQHADDADYQD